MAQALRRRSFYMLMIMVLLLGIGTQARAADALDTGDSTDQGTNGTYKNPLNIQIPGDGKVESCADPTVIRGAQPGDNYWYMYCTTDPLNGEDQNPSGGFNFHLIPMMRSLDLVNWTYMGDAFATRPSWVPDSAGMWAPEVQFFNNQYYLYYA